MPARTVAALCAPRARILVAVGRRRRRLPCTDPRVVHEHRSRLVVLGNGRAHRQSRRRGRRMDRRSPALSFRRVGLVVCDRQRRAGDRGLPSRGAARGKRRASAFVPPAGLRPRDRGERGARSAARAEDRNPPAARAGRRFRRHDRGCGVARVRPQRRDAPVPRAACGRVVAAVRHFLAARHGAHRGGPRESRLPHPQAPRTSHRSQDRRRGGRRARAGGDAPARGGRGARAHRRRASARARAQVRSRREGAPAAALHRHAGLEAAAARAARGSAGVAGDGQQRDARVHLAPHRAQARRLRRERARARGVSGPGHHALRDRAGRRREGRADRQPHQGPRARAVRGVDPRGRDDPRQVVHGPRAAQPAAAGREADRDPVVGHLQRHARRAHARVGQGHRGQAGRRRSRAHAASARRRHDRIRQVGRGQRDDPVASLQGGAEAGPARPDRSQDARAFDVRRHSASAGARRDGHEARAQRAQLVRRRDGAPLQAHVAALGAQPRGLQREGRRGEEGGQAAA